MNPEYLRESADGITLNLKVQPRASRNAVQGIHGRELKISVTAPPVDSAANGAVIEFLAETLGCSKSAIRILRGPASRHKTVLIQGLAASEIARRLSPA